MADKPKIVQDHYTHGKLLESILAFLQERGVDPQHPSWEDLSVCDQMHGRGIIATQEHFEHAGIVAGMDVLDIGCALGGSARYIAATCDCRVTGIDLTEEYIQVARELTRRCGLGDKIEYFNADALNMPFEDASFDHAWCQNVTMNIEDKAGLVAEIARVLKPGSRFSYSEFALGSGGEPYYPLPWAPDQSCSFLVTAEEMRATLEGGGFRVVERLDLTEPNAAFRREVKARAQRGEPALTMHPLIFKYGDAFLERGQNVNRSAEEGRLLEQLIVAEKS